MGDSEECLNKHDLARWGKEEMGKGWDDFYSFAFVRSPWDKLVSWYAMIENNKGKHRNKLRDYVIGDPSGFEGFAFNCVDVVNDLGGRESFAYRQLGYTCIEVKEEVKTFVEKASRE